MPHTADDSSDFEKLQKAFGEITSMFGSVDSLLEAFGLADMPVAQRYGVFFGCLVFFFTIVSVMVLLTLGGSFKRIAEQADTGKATIQTDYKARRDRPLLLERLLDARQRLLSTNYPDRAKRKEQLTNLTKMLMNVPPPKKVADLVDENAGVKAVQEKEQQPDVMTGYLENFVTAYRKCQDKPGGAMLTGRPEARFEAYARAYAGCGDYAGLSYRRSYSRVYENICCESHKDDDKFSSIYEMRPEDVIGKWVRLEALESRRHLTPIFAATSGDMCFYKKSYDPDEVWGFLEEGPFKTQEELKKSFVFQHYHDQAAFALVQNLSDRVLGVVLLSKDDPANLSIQLEPPIVGPSSFGGKEQLEACFLLMDRLFSIGYRRIQLSVDAKDMQSTKLADRLGFTLEGCLLKERILKESSRDTNVYGMLNSDWDKGARRVLYSKLYGVAWARADINFNRKEEEIDEQQKVLAEKKAKEAMESGEKNS